MGFSLFAITLAFAPESGVRQVLFICADFLERASASSPCDAGAGRGSRRGASSHCVPPLPGPLLHPMEERECLRFRLRRAAERQTEFVVSRDSSFVIRI